MQCRQSNACWPHAHRPVFDDATANVTLRAVVRISCCLNHAFCKANLRLDFQYAIAVQIVVNGGAKRGNVNLIDVCSDQFDSGHTAHPKSVTIKT